MKRLRSLKKHLFIPFVISVAAGVLVCAAAMLLFSFIMSIVQFPVEWGGAFGYISLSAGCLSSGYILGRKKKREGIKQGFLCGFTLFLISLVLSLALGDISFLGAVGKGLMCAASGVVGGVAGVNRQR